MTLLMGRKTWIGTLPAGASGFTIPTTPATSTAVKVALAPNFSTGAGSHDPYRPWIAATLEGLSYYANGYNQPWTFSPAAPSTAYTLGAAAPTTFVVADAAGGSTFPAGTILRYKLVFANSSTGKKTAPQTSTIDDELVTYVEYTMVGTKDAYITWTDPGGEWDRAYIYRALQSSDTFHLIDYVTASTALYTDAKADSTVRGNDQIVERYRLTLPPIFEGLASHLNRLWGWEPEGVTLSFSQAAQATGERVQEDFPDENFVQIGPEDGLGAVRSIYPHYDSAFVFKRRGCYELTGYSASTFELRRAFSDRGAFNSRCLAARDGIVFILDERGLYYWTPGAEPTVAGASPGSDASPLQPVWDRMNLAASSTFSVRLVPDQRIVVAYVALDFEPTPNTRIVFGYGGDSFVSIDSLVHGSAAGMLEDSQGSLHDIRIDDLGYVWEDGYAQAEGCYAGDNTGAVTGSTGLAIDASAAAFGTTLQGARGCPMERYSSAGVVLDQNRVYVNAADQVTPYYYSSEAVAAGQSVAIGVIPFVVTLPHMALESEKSKRVSRVIVSHDSGVSGTFKVETSVNGGTYTRKTPEPSLSTKVQSIVNTEGDVGFTWSVQISQRYANLGISIRAVTPYVRFESERSL